VGIETSFLPSINGGDLVIMYTHLSVLLPVIILFSIPMISLKVRLISMSVSVSNVGASGGRLVVGF